MKPENFLTFFTATKSFCSPLRSFNRLKWKISLSLFRVGPPSTGLEIKKILRSPFGDQLEKYSRQMQILSRQFV